MERGAGIRISRQVQEELQWPRNVLKLLHQVPWGQLSPQEEGLELPEGLRGAILGDIVQQQPQPGSRRRIRLGRGVGSSSSRGGRKDGRSGGRRLGIRRGVKGRTRTRGWAAGGGERRGGRGKMVMRVIEGQMGMGVRVRVRVIPRGWAESPAAHLGRERERDDGDETKK